MVMMTIDNIEKALPKDWRYLAGRLITGIEKVDLIHEIATRLSKPESDPQVDVAKMNIAGSLRAMGYIVTGGRAGGTLYQVIDWKAPIKKAPVSEWTGLRREAYDWIQSLQRVKEEDYQYFKTICFRRAELRHENSWLYLWAYEIADNVGFWFRLPYGSSGVILQRHKDLPKFKIFICHFSLRDYWMGLIHKCLLASSATSLTITNPTDEMIRDLPIKSSLAYRYEAIYNTGDIGEHPERYLNKRALETLRARERDTSFYRWSYTDPDGKDEATYVIDTWRVYCEAKHRQLAIRRDYIAAQSEYPGKIMYGGKREGKPVLHHLFDPLVGKFHDQAVMLCNEKSLNYSQAPGGKYGISDFSLIMACRSLSLMGYKYIQSGDIMGGGIGLEPKKKKYAESLYKSPILTIKKGEE